MTFTFGFLNADARKMQERTYIIDYFCKSSIMVYSSSFRNYTFLFNIKSSNYGEKSDFERQLYSIKWKAKVIAWKCFVSTME